MTEARLGQELKAKKAAETEMNTAELLAYARQKSGRGSFRIGGELRRLMRKPNMLSALEYVQYGLYDSARFSEDEKARFLGEALHWPLTSEVSDRTWDAATEDKWLADRILAAGGVAVPETVAVIDRGPRAFGDTPKIATANALRDFLGSAPLPLFGKALRSIGSFGAFLVRGADATHLHLEGASPVTFDAFLEELGSDSYVLQKVVRNHTFFEPITRHTATIRFCTFVRDAGLMVPFALVKFPGGDNIADNFWRPGNILAALDPADGRITSIVTRDGLDLVRHDAHPVTGAALIGQTLPDWGRLQDTVQRAAHLFAPVRYQSLDVALTDQGPVVIEINTGGGWDLPQMATGQGFLTDEVRDTFRSWGAKLV